MSERRAAPPWLAAVFLALLVVPFDPCWIDAEQARRGLLLLLAGLVLVASRHLPTVRSEVLLRALVLALLGCGAIAWLGEVWFAGANDVRTFQPLDALYRTAHWLALLVVLRLGAASGTAATMPFVVLLAATSAFGLLQRLGLGEIPGTGYGVEREPVSVFGNLNVASEWTAIVAMAVAVLLPSLTHKPRRTLGLAALVLAGAYLVVNQSRSGLIALPIGLLLLAWLRRRERPWLPLLSVLGGAVLGLVVALAAPRPAPADPASARAEQQRSTSTLAVRLQIAEGATKLWAQSPIFGRGPGQFAVLYPRVRSQDEIEASSHGRQFETEVRTAHDDWLELLVDGGVLALLLFAGVLFALQRGQPDRTRLLPLFLLLLLMLVRGPLWNAPAVAAALWLVGSPAAPPARVRPWWTPAAIALGVLLVVMGVPLLLGNHFAARYLAALAHGQQPNLADARAALAWMPFEPRWLELLTREQLRNQDLADAARLAARALRLRPNHPRLYLNLGEALSRGKQFEPARAVAREGLRLDAGHPELRVLCSYTSAELDDVDGAIGAVVDRPHPLLRQQLGRHFRDLAKLAEGRGASRAAARYRTEHHFFGALDSLAAGTDVDTNEHIAQMQRAMREAERKEARLVVLLALQFLQLGQRENAIGLGDEAAKVTPLTPWQRDAFGAQLDRLSSFAPWRPVLDRR